MNEAPSNENDDVDTVRLKESANYVEPQCQRKPHDRRDQKLQKVRPCKNKEKAQESNAAESNSDDLQNGMIQENSRSDSYKQSCIWNFRV